MPDLSWNKNTWDGSYDWTAEGEEWSAWWGGSEAQWFSTLYPRLHRFLPAGRVLEIAPGYGRWTKYLLHGCQSYVGIDLAEQAVSACRKRYAADDRARFHQNDGISLDEARDGAFDLVFSFDSMVHAELDVLESYIPQIIRKLSPGGVAFIHHSNFFTLPDTTPNPHSRALSVSGERVAGLVRQHGGRMLVQEIINWGGDDPIDCLTLFARQDAYPGLQTFSLVNPCWVDEMNLVREVHSAYSFRTDFSVQIPLRAGTPAAPPKLRDLLRRLIRRSR
jgi:SAM-dependent methyltransferase